MNTVTQWLSGIVGDCGARDPSSNPAAGYIDILSGIWQRPHQIDATTTMQASTQIYWEWIGFVVSFFFESLYWISDCTVHFIKIIKAYGPHILKKGVKKQQLPFRFLGKNSWSKCEIISSDVSIIVEISHSAPHHQHQQTESIFGLIYFWKRWNLWLDSMNILQIFRTSHWNYIDYTENFLIL